MTVTTETFTGTNGSAPASPRVVDVLGTNTGGYGRIESNTFETNQPNLAYHGVVCNWDGNDYADLDTKVKITFNATDAESYPAIGFRMAGWSLGWAEPYGEVEDGYCVYANNLSNNFALQRNENGGETQAWYSGSKNITGGSSWWMRVQAIGTAIKAKMWLDGTSEPGTWDIEVTDASWTSGRVGIRGQAQTANVKTRFDDWTFDDLVSGGGPQALVPNPLAATSTITGTLSSLKSLSGTVTGSGGLTGSLRSLKPLSGSVAGSSALSGALANAKPLAGTVAGTSSITGAMLRTAGLSGTVVGSSGSTGTLASTKALSGSVAGSSGASAALAVARALTGTVAGTSALSGSLGALRPLAGTVAATSGLTGSMAVARALASTIEGVSTITGSLGGGAAVALSGTIDGVSTIVGVLSVARGLSGTVAGLSTVSGEMSADKPLAGIIVATSSITGAMRAERSLSGGIHAVSTVAGSLGSLKSLTGLISAQSEILGTLGTPVAVVLSDVIGPIEIWKVSYASGETVVLAFDPIKFQTLEESNAEDQFRFHGVSMDWRQ